MTTVRDWQSAGPHEYEKVPYVVVAHYRTYKSVQERFATREQADARAAELNHAHAHEDVWYRACHMREVDR